MRIYNIHNLRSLRRELRNNPTSEEIKIWNVIKSDALGFRFRRQHGIGNFIVDFYCPAKQLIIELDGAQHHENKEYDEERTRYFEHLGLTILRFWNSEINNNLPAVIEKIQQALVKK